MPENQTDDSNGVFCMWTREEKQFTIRVDEKGLSHQKSALAPTSQLWRNATLSFSN